MADLLAKFKLVDEMSEKLGDIAESGQQMINQWQEAGDAANAAFEGISSSVTTAAGTVDGVAMSIDSYGTAVSNAAEQTDYWTDAVGNYDKGALEAIYSTEELVEMGLKSAQALEKQERALEECDRAATALSKATDTAESAQSELEKAMEAASKTAEDLAKNEDVSAEAKEALEKASTEAAAAMEELEKAQEEAAEAMRNYDNVLSSGTSNLSELEAAAEGAQQAAENLEQANRRASNATEELASATETAAEEAENAEQSGKDAAEGIANALAAAGITVMVKEIATAVYDMADSFSEAEKIVAASSGATGAELDGLMESAQNVFANSNAESLEEIAVGMTAIATATNQTGKELEETTSKAYDLQDLFGYDMTESARTASALMKNFNISSAKAYDIIATGAQKGADKNGDLLDVLNEYSAQYAALGLSADEFLSSLIEGADAGVFSVDKVGDAVKEFNIRAKDGSDASAEAFELLGMNADVMTAKFAAGGDTASGAFFEVVNALEAMDDPVQKNAAAVALFGTMYEDLEQTVLPVLSSIEGGTVDTSDALSKAAENAQSMGDGWQEAGNSIKTAFTKAISPTVEKASKQMSGIAKSVGDFLNEHPTVTKAITAIGVGLGVATTALAAVAFATSSAIPAIVSFGTALNTALGPIGWVALAIAGVTAAIGAFIALQDDATSEVDGLTASSRAQYYELQNLEAEYEAACEKYGETSEEASSLRYQVDVLSESFEANKKSVEELVAECDEVIQKHNDLMTEIDDTTESVRNEELGNLALITRLEELATSTTQTSATQMEMEAIIDGLNESLGGLNLSYEDLVENQDAAMASLRAYAEAEAKQQKQQAMYEEYVSLIRQQAEEEAKLAEVKAEVAEATEWNNVASEEYFDYLTQLTRYDTTGMAGISAMFSSQYKEAVAAEEALEAATNSQTELQAAYDETTARIAELEQEWQDIATSEQEAAEEAMTYEEAVVTAYQSVQSEIEALCAAYDAAYESAVASFEGQFGLFDEASTKSEEYLNATVSNAQEALDSQLSYWEEYNANLETLKEYGEGLTGEAKENYELLLQYAQDGSEEAAGLAESIASEIESGNTAAVEELASTVSSIAAEQEAAAAVTADWQTNFTEQMNQYAQEMSDMVTNDMNLSEEAAASATSTLNGYINSILASKGSAVAAAKSVANAVSAALSTTATVNVGVASSTPGHADGTTNAESVFVAGEEGPELIVSKAAAYASGTTDSADFYIAGENGPELIVGQQGSTVFPTEETDRLINALSERQPLNVVAEEFRSEGREQTTEQVKRILLEVAGSGAIDITGSGGADKESILEVLYEHLKPVLMNILQSEIYEEGELSYEY